MGDPSDRQVVDLSDESITKLAAEVALAVEVMLQRLDTGTREVSIAEIRTGALRDLAEAIKRATLGE